RAHAIMSRARSRRPRFARLKAGERASLLQSQQDMKRALQQVALLSLLAVPFASRAELDVRGQVRARSEAHDDTDFSGTRAFHLMRFRPTFAFTGPGE